MARTLPHRSLKLHFWPPVLFPAQQTQAPAFPVLSDQSVLFCVSHICSVRLLTLNTHSVLVPNRIPSSVFSECLSILSSDTKGFRRNVPQMRQDFSPLPTGGHYAPNTGGRGTHPPWLLNSISPLLCRQQSSSLTHLMHLSLTHLTQAPSTSAEGP